MLEYHDTIRRVLLFILAFGFLYSGIMKLIGKETAEFVAWGFPAWFVYVIGTMQVFGACGFFYTPTVRMSLFFLTVIMICAILTLAGKHQFLPDLILPICYLLGLFALMYLKTKQGEEGNRWGLL
jgi:uncharacterized membrane protein YphA (DoxX/SURF4 family)